jgi:hypothetical protein
MTDRGPLSDPELELRAHLAGVNFATQTLLRMVDDAFRRMTGYSPDWEVVAQNLESGVQPGDDPYSAVNRRGRYIAAGFMRDVANWSQQTGSPGPGPAQPPQTPPV